MNKVLVTSNVGKFCVTGAWPAVAALKRALDRVKAVQPDLWRLLGTAGMLCCRAIAGTSTYSNHAFGMSVDITVGGVLDTYGDGKVQQGLVDLSKYMAAEGFYWGAGFPTEDGMHFEVSSAEANRMSAAGLFTKAPQYDYSALTGISGCAWPTVTKVSGLPADPVAAALQHFLNHHCNSLTADGLFGALSAAALSTFQATRGLPGTGATDETTWKALWVDARNGDSGSWVKGLQRLMVAKLASKLPEDGVFSDAMTAEVVAMQKARNLPGTGVVDYPTFQALVTGCSAPKPPTPSSAPTQPPVTQAPVPLAPVPASGITAAQLRCVMTRLTAAQSEQYVAPLNAAMSLREINTNLRIAAFLAQIAHESGELRYWNELGNCNYLEGRKDLGNTSPGDGCRYKGRGPLQLTGKANYAAAGKSLGMPLVDVPESVSRPEAGFASSVWFWSSRGLNKWADAGDFDAITYRVNGGYNGKASRDAYYSKAKDCLGGASSGSDSTWRTFKRGDSGFGVTVIQWLLTHHGAMLAPCVPDGDFGPCTQEAVRRFQIGKSVAVDGAVSTATWRVLLLTLKEANAGTMPNVVKALQVALLKHRYTGTVDGKWTAALSNALLDFQKSADLDVDAVAGPVTWEALVSSAGPATGGFLLAAESTIDAPVFVSDTATVDQVVAAILAAAIGGPVLLIAGLAVGLLVGKKLGGGGGGGGGGGRGGRGMVELK